MPNSGALLPIWRYQVFDGATPANGAKLYTWLSGTTTPYPLYTTAALTVERTNPVVADSDGVFPVMYMAPVAYRMEITDSNGVVIFAAQDGIYDFGQVSALNTDVTGTAGEAIAMGDVVYLSASDGFWYKTDADATGTSSTAGTIGIATDVIASGSAGAIRLSGRVTGLTGLVTGDLYYVSATAGAITTTPPTNQRFVGQADSTTSLVVMGNPGGVRLPDSDGTHSLVIKTTSNLTADRLLTFVTGDAARTITLTGDVTLPGKVVQIVAASYATQTTSSSNAHADTGLTATITPTSASNKVLVLVVQAGCNKSTGNTYMELFLLRAGSLLVKMETGAGYTGTATQNSYGACAIAYLDSPATISATIYKTTFASVSNIAQVQVQYDGNGTTSTIVLMEVTP